MEFIIRKCEPQDLEDLVALCSQHAEYEQADYLPEGKSALLKKVMYSLEPSLHVLVVSVSNKLVGYASYTFDFSTWSARKYLYLDCLYINPEFRSFGIGEELTLRLKEVARANECVNIQWQTPVWNSRAIKFYQRLGGLPKEKIRFTMNP